MTEATSIDPSSFKTATGTLFSPVVGGGWSAYTTLGVSETGGANTDASLPNAYGLSTGAKIGIGIGVPLGVILGILCLWILWRRKLARGITSRAELPSEPEKRVGENGSKRSKRYELPAPVSVSDHRDEGLPEVGSPPPLRSSTRLRGMTIH